MIFYSRLTTLFFPLQFLLTFLLSLKTFLFGLEQQILYIYIYLCVGVCVCVYSFFYTQRLHSQKDHPKRPMCTSTRQQRSDIKIMDHIFGKNKYLYSLVAALRDPFFFFSRKSFYVEFKSVWKNVRTIF